MKKTLVIHPTDASTTFLNRIYKGKDYTVVNDCNISKSELKSLIRAHNRIIMCGHGLPNGLINPSAVKNNQIIDYSNLYLIDDSFAEILREKETISIWCYSDAYFRKHHIPGFHTGMIISEVAEERYILGQAPLNEQQINDNMNRFADIVGDCIELSPLEMRKYILAHYTGNDAVTQFNRKNIIVL